MALFASKCKAECLRLLTRLLADRLLANPLAFLNLASRPDRATISNLKKKKNCFWHLLRSCFCNFVHTCNKIHIKKIWKKKHN